MKKTLSSALLVAGIAIASLGIASVASPKTSAALAQSANARGNHSSRHEFNRGEAIHIANLNGVSRVRHVERRGRYWIVLGETHGGRNLMRVQIDARSGRVVGMNRVRR